MSYLKLLKLLYLADRAAFVELGRPITFDRYVSMPHGPVLSRTCDLVTGEPDPLLPSYWHRHISAPRNYEVELIGQAPNDQLSPAEENILDRVFNQWGHAGRWELVKYTHGLPEYRDPQGSAIPIQYEEILFAQGLNEDDVKAIAADLAAEESLDLIAG